MITRHIALFIALGFMAAFVISLSLDLHGAVAVVCAVGFFMFLSATIDSRWKILRLIKQIAGIRDSDQSLTEHGTGAVYPVAQRSPEDTENP